MEAGRWQTLDQLFGDAVDLDPADREAFLADLGRRDPSLAFELARLLTCDARAVDFLEPPVSASAESAPVNSAMGRLVGSYRLVQELGRGGMGTVYLAALDDAGFRRLVAVKLIRRGMDTDAIVQRFQAERQILATLDHPNIAKLLEGGVTDDGRPYFAMEYVAGTTIDAYCEQRQASTAERVALVRHVALAVECAHRHLIVHRDIKPGNILVTADGTPKLLDFGIAKWLDPTLGPLVTEASGLRPMTPDYASPEQRTGAAITTATDVYSLGVLLHKLLTGRLPSEPEPGEDEAPGRAGRVRRLRGDLHAIVQAAIRDEPSRRMKSADQLADDLRRYLAGLPVSARPDTWSYRRAKFIQRHRPAVAGSAVIGLTLVAGVSATVWQARVASAQSQKAAAETIVAARRLADVRHLASLISEFNDALAALPGATPYRAQMAARMLAYLDGLAKEAATDRQLQIELAVTYQRIGDIQGKPYQANVGDSASALRSYRQSAAILEALAPLEADDPPRLAALGSAYERIGRLLSRMDDARGAIDSQRHALQIREQLVRARPGDREAEARLADSCVAAGDAVLSGDIAAARSLYERSLAIREELARAGPADPQTERDLAASHHRLASVFEGFGDNLSSAFGPSDSSAQSYRLSLEHRRQSLAIARRLLAGDPANAQAQRLVADSSGDAARAMADAGDLKGAVALGRESLAMFEHLAATDPANREAAFDLSISHRVVGDLFEMAGDTSAALGQFRAAVALNEHALAADPPNSEQSLILVGSYSRLGRLLVKRGDLAGAEAIDRKLIALGDRMRTSAPPDPKWYLAYSTGANWLADRLIQSGRIDDARALSKLVLASYRRAAEAAGAGADDFAEYAAALLESRPADLRRPQEGVLFAARAAALASHRSLPLEALLMRAYGAVGDEDRALATAKVLLSLVPEPFRHVDERQIRRRVAEFRK